MMYAAGQLNEHLTLLNPELRESEYGGGDTEFVDKGVIWANVKFQKAGSIMAHGQIFQQGSIVVTIRLNNNVSGRSRFKYRGKLYRCNEPDIDYYERTMTIVCNKIDE